MKMEITLIMPGPFAARKNSTFSGKHTRRIVFLRPLYRYRVTMWDFVF